MATLVEISNSRINSVQRISSLACGIGMALGLVACGNTGADYQPVLDGTPGAHYSADLAACQQLAKQRSYLNDNVKSEAALGAGLGALVGAADEGVEGAIAGAVVGGLLGGASRSWETVEDRQQVVTACMQGRNHPVVG